MSHSSFDEDILFEMTKDGPVHCPDRVVVSTDLLRPLKGVAPEKGGSTAKLEKNRPVLEFSEGFDAVLAGQYEMFVQGYIEGCWGKK